MTTFEAAEKFFLGGTPGGGGTRSTAFAATGSNPASHPGGGVRTARLSSLDDSDSGSSQSPLDIDDTSGAEDYLTATGSHAARKTYGATWLRRHVKKNLGTGIYSSHESFLNSVTGRGAGLAPLFEDHALSGYPRDTLSHNASLHHRLAASDADLRRSLRRYNSSTSLLAGSSSLQDGGYFASRSDRGGLGAGGTRPSLRMATIGATKLFGSSPQLNNKRAHHHRGSTGEKLPDIKSLSMPHDINAFPSSSNLDKLPSISDTNLSTVPNGNTGTGNADAKRNRKRRRTKTKSRGLGGNSDNGTASSGTLGTTTTGTSGSLAKSNEEPEAEVIDDGEEYDDDEEEDDFQSESAFYKTFTEASTIESAYIPPGGSPDSQRLEAERQAEEEVKHNWLLEEENKSRMKRFESRCNRLTIAISDEDAVDAIEDRLEELRMMAKPRKDERSVLDRLTADQREKILRMNEIPIASLRKGRRKGWKPIHKLRWASSMVLLLARGVKNRKQYVNKTSEVGQMRRRLEEGEPENTSDTTIPDKPSLGLDLLLALTTQPHLRTTKTVKRILWLLRATKAFKNLFPAEMEMELAKVVGYERYDDGRIITKQGRAPDRFYYIISGKIGLYRQYQLSTGQVTKGMGFITKGMTTDPTMIEKQRCREDSLVAKGQVEVLIVDKDAFSYLQHTTVGPPIDFLKSLDLFEEFPVERFSFNHEAIEYTYYGTGKVIVKDSNRTPWLHIVKSGKVKVIRSQPVIDARVSNESKFVTPRIEALGCGKPFSHANAMIGVQAKQKKLKSTAHITLPAITREEPLVANPFGTTLGMESVTSSQTTERPSSHRQTPVSRHSKRSKKSKKKSDDSDDEDEEKDEGGEDRRRQSGKERVHGATLVTEPPSSTPHPTGENGSQPADPSQNGDPQDGGQDPSSDTLPPPDGDAARHSAAQKRRRKDATLPIINIPCREPGEEAPYRPHPLWLTRERTDDVGGPQGEGGRGGKGVKEQAHRPAYLQLGVLTPGDVFGLDHMQPALASEAQGVSLLSDGAEVIKISKRFFLQNAGNNTMLKVETMSNEYISEEEAQQVLFDKETWSQYKTALWERMTSQLTPVSSR